MSAYLMDAPELTGTAIRCPGCGSIHTAKVRTPVQYNVLCKTCGSCWHPAGGSVERVDPRQCLGCVLRRICTAAAGKAA